MKLIKLFQQDDCDPDSLEHFESKLYEEVGVSLSGFKEQGHTFWQRIYVVNVMSVAQLCMLSDSALAQEELYFWELGLITTMTASSLLKQDMGK